MTHTPPPPEGQPEFIRRQFEFAAHIRDPAVHPRPADVEDRRMGIYRELFYNNVEGFLSSGFPVLRSLYADSAWERLARGFFANHRCRTPYFLEISREFLDYLRNEYRPVEEDPPFLMELAHYEWVELALSVSDEEPELDTVDSTGDLLTGRPVLSPLAWPLSYEYPVHRIGTDFRPQRPGEQPTFLLVHRDSRGEIHFMELNPVTARLLALIGEEPEKSGRELAETIAEELRHPDPGVVVEGGRQTLQDLRAAGVICGTRK